MIQIPKELPTIKAAIIKPSNDAYTNPQVSIDKSYQIFNEGNQKAIQDGFMLGLQTKEYNKKEKQAQMLLNKQTSKETTEAINSVVGLKNTGNSTFDTNKQNYFYHLKDQYVEIQRMMEKNPDMQQEGAKQLAKINDQVSQYSAASGKMMEQIVGLQTALKIPMGQPGAVSSTNRDDMQRLLTGIIQGGPNVTLTNNNGNLVLYMPPQTYTQNGEEFETAGVQFNMNSFLQLEAGGGDLIETVPDYKKEIKGIAGEIIQDANGEDNPLFYKDKTIQTGDGTEAIKRIWSPQVIDPVTEKPMVMPETLTTMGRTIKNPFYDSNNPNQKVDGEMFARIKMIQDGAFDSMLNPKDPNDKDFSVIWSDVIGMEDGMPGQLTTWDPMDKEIYDFEGRESTQLGEALRWLSTNATDEYGVKEGIYKNTTRRIPKATAEEKAFTKTTKKAKKLFGDFKKATTTLEAADSYFIGKQFEGGDIVEVINANKGADGGIGRPDDYASGKVGKIQFKYIDRSGKGAAQTKTSPVFNMNDPESSKNLMDYIIQSEYGSSQATDDARDMIDSMIDEQDRYNSQDTYNGIKL